MQNLYRHYNAAGDLLYIGISMSAFARLAQHERSSEWASQIANVTIEAHDTREDVKRAEREAIELEKPLHNIKMNGVKSRRKPTLSDRQIVDRFTELFGGRESLRLALNAEIKKSKGMSGYRACHFRRQFYGECTSLSEMDIKLLINAKTARNAA